MPETRRAFIIEQAGIRGIGRRDYPGACPLKKATRQSRMAFVTSCSLRQY